MADNPDHIFVSHNLRNMSIKSILKAIPKTRHRSIQCQIHSVVISQKVPFRRLLDFKKVKRAEFTKDTEIRTTPANYCKFVDAAPITSRDYDKTSSGTWKFTTKGTTPFLN